MTKENNDPDDNSISLILIGDSSVGKTSLAEVFCGKVFRSEQLSTIGLDSLKTTVTLEEKEYKIKIWDSAGQERFSNWSLQYIKKAQGILLVYNVVNKQSYDKIPFWWDKIKDSVNFAKFPTALLGNQCDLNNREVTWEMGEKMGEDHQIPYFETSAKTGRNVKDAFMAVWLKLIERYNKKQNRQDSNDRGKKKLKKHKTKDQQKNGDCDC